MEVLKAAVVLAIGTILMSSCTHYLTYHKYNESTAQYMNPAMKPGFITPSIADLKVSSEKIIETVSYDNTLTQADIDNVDKLKNSPTIEYLKNYTVSKVVKKYNADVIVAPVFDIKTSDDYEKIEVTLTGYPATYVNFRTVNAADSITMRIYDIEILQPKIEIIQPN